MYYTGIAGDCLPNLYRKFTGSVTPSTVLSPGADFFFFLEVWVPEGHFDPLNGARSGQSLVLECLPKHLYTLRNMALECRLESWASFSQTSAALPHRSLLPSVLASWPLPTGQPCRTVQPQACTPRMWSPTCEAKCPPERVQQRSVFPGPVLPCLLRETFLCLPSGIMVPWSFGENSSRRPQFLRTVRKWLTRPRSPRLLSPGTAPREQPPGPGTQPWAGPGAEAELRTVRLCAFSTSPGAWGSVSVG